MWQCKTLYVYIWMENLFGTVFLMDGKRTKRHDCGWNEICMKHAELEDSLKQSFLFSSTQYNVSKFNLHCNKSVKHYGL